MMIFKLFSRLRLQIEAKDGSKDLEHANLMKKLKDENLFLLQELMTKRNFKELISFFTDQEHRNDIN